MFIFGSVDQVSPVIKNTFQNKSKSEFLLQRKSHTMGGGAGSRERIQYIFSLVQYNE